MIEQAHVAFGIELFGSSTAAQWNPNTRNPDAWNRHAQAAKTTHLFLLLGFDSAPCA
jgi:hypothetical protein